MDDLKATIDSSEQIFYEGKPDKKCYIYESIFNPLLPMAILWGLLDFIALGAMTKTVISENLQATYFLFILPVMLFHLMPVWIYLGGVLLTVRKYKKTNYIITNRAIYVTSGTFTFSINSKPFAELSHINLHRGFFDQIFNVGDITATTNQNSNGVSSSITIRSVSNYLQIYNLVKKLQTDIYADTMYPNDMRPKENHGYNTKYMG